MSLESLNRRPLGRLSKEEKFMSWSEDQRPLHAHAVGASAAAPSAHPAKSVMDQRWQQRRAAADASRSQPAATVVPDRADSSGIQSTRPLQPAPLDDERKTTERLLADMQRLEVQDSMQRADRLAPAAASGPAWLRDTQRAMTYVAAFSCSVLLALLYFGGFLG